MANAVLTIPAAGDASPFASPPCPAFGGAVQALERLHRADAEAQDLPDGDPAYGSTSVTADLAFGLACEALDHARQHGARSIYREAAATMAFGLTAALSEDVAAAHVRFGSLALVADQSLDRTVGLSLERAQQIFEKLARLWGALGVDPQDDADEPVASANAFDWDEAWDAFGDPDEMTLG